MKTKRKGVALITALMVMAVLAIVLTVITAQVVAQRGLLQQRERQLQADWLTRAGIELAAGHLLESPKEFSEEHDDLAPESKLKIEVKKAGDDVFVISADAEVGPGARSVKRSVNARYRRSEAKGSIRLEALAQEKK